MRPMTVYWINLHTMCVCVLAVAFAAYTSEEKTEAFRSQWSSHHHQSQVLHTRRRTVDVGGVWIVEFLVKNYQVVI